MVRHLTKVTMVRPFGVTYKNITAQNTLQQLQTTRQPMQGEIRFTENITEQDGEVVPEIYREHRHKFSQKPEDIDAFKRQVMYRSAHIGTKELEIVLRDWLILNQDKMSYADVEQFDDEILGMENPQLQRYIVNGEPVQKEHSCRYLDTLVEYI